MEDNYPLDANGRRNPDIMSEREMLSEMLVNSRKITDLVEGFLGDLKSGKINPMQMMMGAFKR